MRREKSEIYVYISIYIHKTKDQTETNPKHANLQVSPLGIELYKLQLINGNPSSRSNLWF